MRFVRKNLLTISGRFWVHDSDAEPSGVICTLRFRSNTTGMPTTATIALTLGIDGHTWSGSWDSSAAGEGRVDWVVYSVGSVVSAAEGFFTIAANKANVA